MSCYPESDDHTTVKAKTILDLTNYAIEKELEHDTGFDTPALSAKKEFMAFKAIVDKVDITKLVNVQNSLNN